MNDRNWGLYIGIPFTALVVGLIVYGNFFSTSSHPVNFAWEYRPTLHICDTAPQWAQEDAEALILATEWWEDQGWAFDNIVTGPCNNTCQVLTESGDTIYVTCEHGKVVLDLMDNWWDEDHAGVCRHPAVDVMQDRHWTTILVPNILDPHLEAKPLPQDAKALVLAHEIGHCLAGLGHNQGPVVGCARLNPKTGSVMNPELSASGWVNEAIPTSPDTW